MALRESTAIALLYFLTSAREGGEGSASRTGAPYPGKDPVPIVQEAGWASGLVCTGAENLASTGIRNVQPVGSRYTGYATRSVCCMADRFQMEPAALVIRLEDV